MITLEDFTKAVQNQKLTPAQEKIANKIINGYKIAIVNQHRANGGEYYWSNDEGQSLEYAGKVYRAFWNLTCILRKEGLEENMNFAIVQNNNLRY